MEDFVKILDDTKVEPYGRLFLGCYVCFDIMDDVNCKIGKVVSYECSTGNIEEALWRIETPCKSFSRALLYDIKMGTAKIIDPVLMGEIEKSICDFKEIEDWVKLIPERYKHFINNKEDK